MIVKSCILEGVTTRKDKSVSLRFSTLEQSPNEVAELFTELNKICMLAIKPDAESFLIDEIGALDKIEVDLYDSAKSPSKRLKNVLYVFCEQQLGKKPEESEFKEFYKTKMEQLITHFKDKLL